MSKTVIDSTSLQNKQTGTGANRCAISFGVDAMTFSGQTGATKCRISNIAEPTSSSDATTKNYVDLQISQITNALKWKDAVQARTTDSLSGEYSKNQTLKALVNEALPTVFDSASLAVGNRVLVMSQEEKAQNGIYDIVAMGSATEKWELSRSSDANEAIELTGATCVVIQGQLYNAVVYSQANNVDDMADAKNFVQISTAVNADDFTDGLTKVGARVKVNPDNSTIGIVSDEVAVVTNGITTVQLAPSAVENVNLADTSVSTDKVQALAITNDKLAGSITGDKITDNTLTSNLYGLQSIPSSAYGLRSIQSSNIGLAEIQQDNISTGAVGSDQIENQAVDGSIHVAPNSLVSQNYAAGSVGSDAIATSAVGTSELRASSVVTSKIAAGNITTAKLDSTANQEAVDTSVMRDDCVTNDKLAPSSVATENMINSAITNEKLADGAITSNKFGTLTELNVAGPISAQSIQLGGSSSAGNNSYALCKMIFNHIDLHQKYTFTGDFRRICNNLVQFDYEEAVIAVNATARLIYASETGHTAQLQFVLGVRFYQDATTPDPFTTPISYDLFRNTAGDTSEKEAQLAAFATDATVGNKRIHSVSWWAREASGNGLVAPQGQDFVSMIQVVNDSSNKQAEAWDGTSLSPV